MRASRVGAAGEGERCERDRCECQDPPRDRAKAGHVTDYRYTGRNRKDPITGPATEGVGFEPTEPVKAHCFSRAARSTTPAPLHGNREASPRARGERAAS